MNNKKVFTMIATDNEEFYNKHESLNLLHLYITERVRGFDKCGKTCYMSNEQFAKETNNSISTIKRAIKLLVDLKILWAGYHQESIKNKQRILHIYDERLGNYHEKKKAEVQNDTLRGSNCTTERFKLNTTEVQNEPLVYKEKINSTSLVTRFEPELSDEERELVELGMATLEEILAEREQGYLDLDFDF